MIIVINRGENKDLIEAKLKKLKSGKQFPASKYNAKLKTEEDALAIQKRLRDEWK